MDRAVGENKTNCQIVSLLLISQRSRQERSQNNRHTHTRLTSSCASLLNGVRSTSISQIHIKLALFGKTTCKHNQSPHCFAACIIKIPHYSQSCLNEASRQLTSNSWDWMHTLFCPEPIDGLKRMKLSMKTDSCKYLSTMQRQII